MHLPCPPPLATRIRNAFPQGWLILPNQVRPQGEIVERRSKRGKTFYGCNRYPDCDFVAWGKPLQEKCPECGSSYMIEKWLKAGPVAQCPNAECKYKHPIAGESTA